MQYLLRALLPLVVLALGWGGYHLLGQEKEKTQRPKAPPRVIKTKVLKLHRTGYQTVVRTQGVVRAYNEASLTPQVSGKVTWVSPMLQDGAFFTEGEVLVKIDDADFQTAVIAAEAALARAKAAHAQEEARAKQARVNWEELGYEEEPNELVLRLPQLREAEANVKAAEATLEQAQRELDRTEVRAPFEGRVLAKAVAIGQSVNPSTPLATAYATQFVEVRLPISSDQLQFLSLPESFAQAPVDVMLTDTLNPESGEIWRGKIVGTEGALNADSRELFAIARVDDPFGLRKPLAERGAPLRVGQPVAAAIDGMKFDDVIAVPRDAVRQLNRIYLVVEKEEGTKVLSPRDIEPLWEDAGFYVVRDDGIPEGALLATTRLVYAPRESPVEILPDLPETGTETAAGEASPTDS